MLKHDFTQQHNSDVPKEKQRERDREREREHISSLADSEGNSAAIAANPVFPVFQWDLPTPPQPVKNFARTDGHWANYSKYHAKIL